MFVIPLLWKDLDSYLRSRFLSNFYSHFSFFRRMELLCINNHQYVLAIGNASLCHLGIYNVHSVWPSLKPIIYEQLHDELFSVQVAKGKTFTDLAKSCPIFCNAMVGH